MFGRARWRLTLWFAAGMALIVALIAVAVYGTARTVLFRQVNNDLQARAQREIGPLAERVVVRIHGGGGIEDVQLGPAFTAGGYFYALAADDGQVLRQTANTDPDGLAEAQEVQGAAEDGPKFVDTRSSEGEDLRVYLLPLPVSQTRQLVLEVGRSTEPERQALRQLLLILVAGGWAGLALAAVGGFVLAGRALRPIQDAMDRQRTFVGDASHELRTPLALIRANAEVLKRESARKVEANIASVDDIISETDRLSGLVGQMLKLAGADSGERLALADVDLQALAADVGRQMRVLADAKDIAVRVADGAPARVRGDELLLRELVSILVDNAVKYSDSGASVDVSVGRRDGRLQLQVADSGRGIPPEALPHIFERFYRVDKARSREMGGSGLGLAIAKWIVETHNGTIAIDSAVGQGTRVTVSLWPAA